MPKEQTCLGERPPRSSSKNAKDKSNSAALLASRGRAGMEEDASGRESRCSSEKDSGYSDTGSDSLQTDVEDQRSSVSEPQRAGRDGGGGGGPGGGQGEALHGSNAPLPCTAELTPIYIIKNVVLKQPLTVQPGPESLLHGQLTWGGGSSAQAPTQLLFIQQPGVASPAPLHLLKPQPRKGGGGGKNSKGTYLPILNSYPRIAPHPSKKTPEPVKGGGKGSASEGQSLSKRVCMEERREAVSTTSQVPRPQEGRPHSHGHSHANPRGATAVPAPPSHPQHRSSSSLPRPRHAQKPPSPSDSCGLGSPSVSSSEMPSPPSPASPSSPEGAPSPAPGPGPGPAPRRRAAGSAARQQRFLNTVEILSQSGLLDITLRTQELLRQSASTERDIAQLRRHAQLLCQAAQAGEDAPAAWDRLLQAMAESGRYPSLAFPAPAAAGRPAPEADPDPGAGKSQPVVVATAAAVSLGGRDSEVAPPSPLLAPTPDPPPNFLEEGQLSPTNHNTAPLSAPTTLDQARTHRVKTPIDIVMPPDSSTHGALL
ncbi:CLOCK-interacting pacemaker [Megalops cyprinoides]|uniref:CLOCK-interacting pacemaker n=1 Tax=Megalops cyprinoides TaxID=118141 RepID=UPI0018642AAE|nr:CLOCK-interacting pacemaker [Megalops cyprinoides]